MDGRSASIAINCAQFFIVKIIFALSYNEKPCLLSLHSISMSVVFFHPLLSLTI